MKRTVPLPLALGLGLALVTLVVVGCGDDSDSVSTDDELPEITAASVPDVSSAVAAESPELEPYLGLTEEEAGGLADEEGRPWRVVEVDGQPRPITLDLNPDRVNFVITGGVVTGVTTG